MNPPSKALPSSKAMLRDAKWAFVTRRVDRSEAAEYPQDVEKAVSGDLILAEVEHLGQHKRLQLPCGRPSQLYVGDLVVVVCATRYAPDFFEAEAAIDPDGCDLVAAGGIAGRIAAAHERIGPATRLRPIGRLIDRAGRPLNVSRYGLPDIAAPAARPPILAVLGTTMNAGKTTTAASLARGLKQAGLKIGVAKLTGTGACGDVNAYKDAGICDVLDFTDAGLGSTYRVPLARLETATATLMGHLTRRGCQAIIVELADGMLQQETAGLMRAQSFQALCDGVVFAAGDALGAKAGVATLSAAGLSVVGVSGIVCRSALALQEAQTLIGVRTYTREELMDPKTAVALLGAAIEGPSPKRFAA